MRKMFFSLSRIAGVLVSFMALTASVMAQSMLYSENFGTPTSNTLVQNYSGWQDSTVTYSGDGTCDIRLSSASQGYGLASGGGNVMINDTIKWFMVSGINTSSESDLSLYCGLRKNASENGSNFVVEVSPDGIIWTRVYLADTLPSGSGTAGWYRVRYLNIPSFENLHIRFSNLVRVDYRLDDITLVVGEEVRLETAESPAFSPSGGVYFEPQVVELATSTPNAVIHFTFDDSTPDEQSDTYLGPLTINNTTIVKAIAMVPGMYNSEVSSAKYVIIDTNSLVELPFDISDNSDVTHADITQLNGFRAYHLGVSYADGAAKFEPAHVGEAMLVAHLDSAPDTLVFELKGNKSGASPASYDGVTFTISSSEDGSHWSPIATLYDADISTDNYTRFAYCISGSNVRYVRWKLESCNKGNTRLNNIRITKSTYSGDSTVISEYHPETFGVYPNPTSSVIHIHQGGIQISSLVLYNIYGQIVKVWFEPDFRDQYIVNELPRGTYILKANTPNGTIQKKVVIY